MRKKKCKQIRRKTPCLLASIKVYLRALLFQGNWELVDITEIIHGCFPGSLPVKNDIKNLRINSFTAGASIICKASIVYKDFLRLKATDVDVNLDICNFFTELFAVSLAIKVFLILEHICRAILCNKN